jgi:glucose/arabinose dehydrogenase
MRASFTVAPMFIVAAFCSAHAADKLLTGVAAFGSWKDDAPGVRRLIRPADLPAAYASGSASNGPQLVPRPDGAMPKVPEGFTVALFARDLQGPRTIRVAPNGDIFVAESEGGRIHVFRAPDGAERPVTDGIFADGFDYPYGIAFYPPGPDPKYVYVAQTDRIVRFPYANGDLKARGHAEVIVDGIPTGGGHLTRAIAFSPDGKQMFVGVGSLSDAGEGMGRQSPSQIQASEASGGIGAAWGPEDGRAAVLAFDPDGKNGRIFASGIRNCSGLTVAPGRGDVWCATNERDGLGDNLPPDYVSRIAEGAFYGWPWYYIGGHEDPRHKGERPDLAGKITVPDVLIQPHSAPLGITFYDGTAFPEEYRGDAFVALHGSWNRRLRTGYKVVRIILKNGSPTGEYEDFLTGFVSSADDVWGRPVGVAVAHDGALLVSEDGNNTIWRVERRRPADGQ